MVYMVQTWVVTVVNPYPAGDFLAIVVYVVGFLEDCSDLYGALHTFKKIIGAKFWTVYWYVFTYIAVIVNLVSTWVYTFPMYI